MSGESGVLKEAGFSGRTDHPSLYSDEQFRLIHQIGGIGGFDFDLASQTAVCTDEFHRIVGLAEGEVVTLERWREIVHPEDRDRIMGEIERSLAEGRGVEQTYRIVRPIDGETRWISGKSALLAEEGEAARYVGGIIDITKIKSIESRLVETGRRLDAILNNTKMAILMMDHQQHCVFMNKAAQDLTGYALEETLGRPLHDVVHHTRPDGSHYPLEECPIDRAFPERNQVRGEELFVHKDGHFYPVAFTASPIRNDDGDPIGTIIEAQDITEIKREERLRSTQNEVLEMAIAGRPLDEPLTELLRTVEACSKSDVVASILLLDRDGKLHHGAAPSLPQEYIDAIDGVQIGLNVGSCGTAAYLREPVHVSDIANDPRWEEFKAAALAHDLKACWSFPIMNGKKEVLGTFALYYREVRDAAPDDIDLVEFVTRAASLVIEKDRAGKELSQQAAALTTLNNVGIALAAERDLERIVQIVTDSGVALCEAAFGAFFHNNVTKPDQGYMLYTLSGADKSAFESFPAPRATQVFHPTFSGTSVVRSDDILQDPRYGQNPPFNGMPSGHLAVRSYLSVPVVSRSGEVLGGLLFGHPDVQRFSQSHEDLLLGLAGQAAIAIDNARLFLDAQKEIAERKEAEERVRELNATLEHRIHVAVAEREEAESALRQAQKMEAVGQLTGGVAHDFNNLLTVISGNIDMALRRLGDEGDDRLTRFLSNAQIASDRAAVLTQRLLAFSRRQPLKPQPTEANRLVLEMSDILHRTLGENIEVSTNLEADLWLVEVDTNQLESAIINLAVNARDAILDSPRADTGRLEIETANVCLDHEFAVQDANVQPGEYVQICISDNGCGMSEDVIKRVFEPFFTTKEVGRGTGLGLSMVYGFVRQSGGVVAIESEVDRGATVKIFLPRFHGTESRPATSAGTGGKNVAVRPGMRILVCEDDAHVRAFSAEVLRDLGYHVIEAKDGPEALQYLQTDEPIDLLFTDIVLPNGMTGDQIAEKARVARPDLKVLFTTGYARNSLTREGRLEAGVDLLTKPFKRADLAEKITEVLSR